MTTWKYTIRLADVWKNPDLTFEQCRDEIALRLKSSSWAAHNSLVVELANELAGVANIAEFDDVWRDVYDEADVDRAWLAVR